MIGSKRLVKGVRFGLCMGGVLLLCNPEDKILRLPDEVCRAIPSSKTNGNMRCSVRSMYGRCALSLCVFQRQDSKVVGQEARSVDRAWKKKNLSDQGNEISCPIEEPTTKLLGQLLQRVYVHLVRVLRGWRRRLGCSDF